MVNQPHIGVVILNAKDDQLTLDCIDSLYAGTYRSFSVVVVDNAPDLTLKGRAGQQKGRDVHIIENGSNIGFCRGCNVGIRYCLNRGSDYIMLLNNDTIAGVSLLEALVNTGELHGRKAVIAPKIYYEHDRALIWYAGGYLDYLQGVGKHCGFKEIEEGKYDTPRVVTYVTGCCMLVPSEIYQCCGLMKEELFMYMDDTEYSMRLKKCGVRMVYEPGATLFHKVGGGTEVREYSALYLYHITRNRIYVTSNLAYRIYLLLVLTAVTLGRLAVALTARRPRLRRLQVSAILRGYRDCFKFGSSSYYDYIWN